MNQGSDHPTLLLHYMSSNLHLFECTWPIIDEAFTVFMVVNIVFSNPVNSVVRFEPYSITEKFRINVLKTTNSTMNIGMY